MDQTAWYRKNSLLWISIAATLIGGLLVYRLYPIPFGPIFNTSLALVLAGVFLTFLLLSLRLITEKRVWKRLVGSCLLLVPILLVLLVATIAIDHRVLYFRALPPRLTTEQWREDLACLAEKMEERHPNLFSKISKEDFNRAVTRFDQRMPKLTDNQILAGFFEIAALPRDGHTFPLIFSPCYDLHVFPLKTHWFGEDLYIVDAGREKKRTIGSRIVKVGGTPIEEVRQKCARFVPADGKYNALDRSAMVLMVAELLEAEGIIQNCRRTVFTLENRDGELYDVTLTTTSHLVSLFWSMIKTVENTAPPVIPNDRVDHFWFELRENTKTLYFGFNSVVNESGDETIEEFTERLIQFIDTHDVDRLVVDIRSNDGGDGRRVPALVEAIKSSEKINRRGRLFVLTGRRTFSAAVMFASVMANNTKAVFIGEPTGQGPIFYSIPRQVDLPNSRLEFLVSTMPTQSSIAGDNRPWIEPDVYVEYTIEDFLTGRDPEMDAVLGYEPEVRAIVPLSEGLLDAYVGRYEFSPYQVLTIERNDGGGLTFAIDDFMEGSCVKVSSDLYPVTESRFLTDIRDVELEFCFDARGRVEELDVVWKGAIQIVRPAPEGYELPMELIAAGRIDEGIEAILDHKDAYRDNYSGLEQVFNTMGYGYLQDESYDDAIRIFALNVELFPQSSNVYDSLGEAYMENGQTELATQNYEKSLELNPDNANAEERLKRLRDG